MGDAQLGGALRYPLFQRVMRLPQRRFSLLAFLIFVGQRLAALLQVTVDLPDRAGVAQNFQKDAHEQRDAAQGGIEHHPVNGFLGHVNDFFRPPFFFYLLTSAVLLDRLQTEVDAAQQCLVAFFDGDSRSVRNDGRIDDDHPGDLVAGNLIFAHPSVNEDGIQLP